METYRESIKRGLEAIRSRRGGPPPKPHFLMCDPASMEYIFWRFHTSEQTVYSKDGRQTKLPPEFTEADFLTGSDGL